MNLNIRNIESASATEIYITAASDECTYIQEQAREIFTGILDVLYSTKSYILQERIFGTKQALEILRQTRSEVYGDFNDGVAPSFLIAKEGLSGPITGVQVHAVNCVSRPQVVNLGENPCGRILSAPGHEILTLSSISDQAHESAAMQARTMMEKAEAVLKQFGVDFLSVPRTWMWLKDILSWYDEFNDVRTSYFKDRGLIGPDFRQSMPASTGIGLCPSDRSDCSMDLVAVLKPQRSICFLPAVGNQQSALEYGSAFSRASKAITPAGETVYVSGTASIDANGVTTNINDAAGQVNATIENVRAVLRDMDCGDEDVVQVIAYCKTTEVEQIFNSYKDNLPWPWLTVICDICRHDLLFEIEAAATHRKSL